MLLFRNRLGSSPLTASNMMNAIEDDPITWRDHMSRVSEVASLLSTTAAQVADPETRAALLTTAHRKGHRCG
jgi:hypothetical protein